MPEDHSAFEQIRAAERMRIAQQLHDSTLQLLAVLQLTLGRMRRQGNECLEANITECEEMIAQIGLQMREIGHTPVLSDLTIARLPPLQSRKRPG